MDNAGTVSVNCRKRDYIDLILDLIDSQIFRNAPGTIPLHGQLAGFKHILAAGIGKLRVSRGNTLFDQVRPALDSGLGLRIVKSGGLLIVRDNISAERSDGVIPSCLLIQLYRCAVDSLLRIRQLFSDAYKIIPGPVVRRIVNSRIIKDLFVIPYGDGVKALRHAIPGAVHRIQVDQALREIFLRDRLGALNQRAEICQHTASRVFRHMRRIHPENIRRASARCAGLQSGKVFLVRSQFDLNLDVRILFLELIRDRPKGRFLVGIPDTVTDRNRIIRHSSQSGRKHAKRHRAQKESHGNLFSLHSDFLLF